MKVFFEEKMNKYLIFVKAFSIGVSIAGISEQHQVSGRYRHLTSIGIADTCPIPSPILARYLPDTCPILSQYFPDTFPIPDRYLTDT
jgi:hypothetical protein